MIVPILLDECFDTFVPDNNFFIITIILQEMITLLRSHIYYTYLEILVF